MATTFLALNPIGAPNVPGTWTNTGPLNNVQLGPMKITKYQEHTARLDQQFGSHSRGLSHIHTTTNGDISLRSPSRTLFSTATWIKASLTATRVQLEERGL